MAELHGDLFSHHASPLEVYVFVAVANRGEHVMSGEICRRCNGKQQGRRRGGRSVQLSDSFMILHSSSRHSCTYTYVLYVRPNIFSGKKRKPPRRSGLGMDMYCTCVQNFRVYFLDINGVDIKFWCGKHACVLYVVACDNLVLV